MEITLSRSGGFAGFIDDVLSKIDTDKIPALKKKEIKNLIKLSDFFNQENSIDSIEVTADGFLYKISIQDSGNTKSVEFYDDDNNLKIKNLLKLKDFLIKMGQE
jgi:hypothetical protein